MNATGTIRSAPPRGISKASKFDPRTKLVALARSLASTVAKGFLSANHADATLLVSTLRATRIGDIDADPVDLANILGHIMRLHAANLAVRRSVATWRVSETARSLILIRAEPGRIFSEAHNTNSDSEFVLQEYEVANVVLLEMAAAMEGRR